MTKAHKPNYHWIRINDTSDWRSDFVAEIGPDAKIVSMYIFDKDSSVNLCELTPSHALYRASTYFTTSRDMSSEEREMIEEKIRVAQIDEDDVKYIHCSFVKKSEPVRQFIDCDSDVNIEEVIEYYQSNPW